MTAPRTWSVSVIAPGPFLTANVERFYHRRSALVRTWRQATVVGCQHVRLPKGVTGPVTIQAVVRYGTPRPPVRDRLNLASTIKAVVDALTPPRTFARKGKTYITVGFGFLVDDDDSHVADTTWRMEPSGQPGRSWIDLTITEVTP